MKQLLVMQLPPCFRLSFISLHLGARKFMTVMTRARLLASQYIEKPYLEVPAIACLFSNRGGSVFRNLSQGSGNQTLRRSHIISGLRWQQNERYVATTRTLTKRVLYDFAYPLALMFICFTYKYTVASLLA